VSTRILRILRNSKSFGAIASRVRGIRLLRFVVHTYRLKSALLRQEALITTSRKEEVESWVAGSTYKPWV
jgi:hypothetical protein